MDKQQEMQARITALQIALRQSQEQAISGLEIAVSAIIANLSKTAREKVVEELNGIESLTPEHPSLAQIYSDSSGGIKPQRQQWREELAGLEVKLQSATETPASEGGANE